LNASLNSMVPHPPQGPASRAAPVSWQWMARVGLRPSFPVYATSGGLPAPTTPRPRPPFPRRRTARVRKAGAPGSHDAPPGVKAQRPPRRCGRSHEIETCSGRPILGAIPSRSIHRKPYNPHSVAETGEACFDSRFRNTQRRVEQFQRRDIFGERREPRRHFFRYIERGSPS